MFLHHPLIMGYNSRKFGMTLSGRNYIMLQEHSCSCQYRGTVAGLIPVSVRQVKSKDVPCSDD